MNEKKKYDFIILYRKQEIVLIVGNAQKTWGVGGGVAPKRFIQLVMPRGPFLGCQRAVFTTVKVLTILWG
jgi:hypothetical protein